MPNYKFAAAFLNSRWRPVTLSIAMDTRLHINLYITTSVPMLVLLSQNAQSDEKVILSRCTIHELITLILLGSNALF